MYRARDTTLDRDVALKFLPADVAAQVDHRSSDIFSLAAPRCASTRDHGRRVSSLWNRTTTAAARACTRAQRTGCDRTGGLHGEVQSMSPGRRSRTRPGIERQTLSRLLEAIPGTEGARYDAPFFARRSQGRSARCDSRVPEGALPESQPCGEPLLTDNTGWGPATQQTRQFGRDPANSRFVAYVRPSAETHRRRDNPRGDAQRTWAADRIDVTGRTDMHRSHAKNAPLYGRRTPVGTQAVRR
jgi:hypothetical protein